MNRLTNPTLAVALFVFSVNTTILSGQMGLRENDLFSSGAFAKVGPPIGSVVPDLDLSDLEGNPVSLKSYRGQTVILVKGGYT